MFKKNEKEIVIESGETLGDEGLAVMIGQIGQSNNLALARLMMNGLGGDYAPQAIVGSKHGLTLIIQFEGKDKRITITDVQDEIAGGVEQAKNYLEEAADIFRENTINKLAKVIDPISLAQCACGAPLPDDNELCADCQKAATKKSEKERDDYENEGKRP